ncbi:hypothetical protein H4Q26_005176 [Puccinia striiformis f. sp. tritici PST-130]|nr:hypothetical protein H4Q26_005176 [Puccinia striiformis f. sp. tritici PST-130]
MTNFFPSDEAIDSSKELQLHDKDVTQDGAGSNSTGHTNVACPLPSADQDSGSKYQDSGRGINFNDKIGVQSSPRKSDWISGHLLLKKDLSNILSEQGILYKT